MTDQREDLWDCNSRSQLAHKYIIQVLSALQLFHFALSCKKVFNNSFTFLLFFFCPAPNPFILLSVKIPTKIPTEISLNLNSSKFRYQDYDQELQKLQTNQVGQRVEWLLEQPYKRLIYHNRTDTESITFYPFILITWVFFSQALLQWQYSTIPQRKSPIQEEVQTMSLSTFLLIFFRQSKIPGKTSCNPERLIFTLDCP